MEPVTCFSPCRQDKAVHGLSVRVYGIAHYLQARQQIKTLERGARKTLRETRQSLVGFCANVLGRGFLPLSGYSWGLRQPPPFLLVSGPGSS